MKRRQPRRVQLALDGAPALRWQHGQDDEIVASTQRVLRPVDELRRDGHVNDDHVRAAERFHTDHAFGIAGVNNRIGRAGYTPGRLNSAGRFRAAVVAVGPDAATWLDAITVRELALPWLAERLHKSLDHVRCQTVSALQVLALHYRAADRQAGRERAAARREMAIA